MPQAVQALEQNSRRVLMQWLTQHGPFWEDAREHGEDDYLDCFRYEDRIVTDTAVGEAAFCKLHGLERGLVSLIPSSWRFSPVPVEFHEDDRRPKHRGLAISGMPLRLEARLERRTDYR